MKNVRDEVPQYHVWKKLTDDDNIFIVSGDLDYCHSVVELLRKSDSPGFFWVEDDIGRLTEE